MATPLRVLIVDDSEDDAVLIAHHIRRGGYDLTFERVDTPEAMLAALEKETWDAIISDYTMPHFSGPEALRLFRESGLDLPFIVVSGTIGEETAVAMLKAGAHDFVLKNNLARLTPAIERELREVESHRARREAEKALKESEERYALAASGANDGLWDWNLKTNEIYYSPRWKSLLGHEENEIGNTPEEWFNRVHPDDLQQLRQKITLHQKGLSPHFECEYRMRHRNGSYRWMLTRGLAVRDALGKAYRMAGSQTDITDRKTAEEQLLYDALHDSLTGLPNRTLLTERLGAALERAKREPEFRFAVLLLDLDRIQVITDSLGHTVADQLIIGITQRLEANVRPGDTVAHLGGDEFAVLLEGISDADEAERFALQLQKDLARSFKISEYEVFTTASIGIALSRPDYERPEELLRDADTANHRAKVLGRARHVVFDAAMRDRAVSQLRLETDLWRAVEGQEFRVFYQPIVSLERGRLAGFEALVRWRRREADTVPPAEFVPLAEETGLIIPVGRWVLREACRQMREWQTRSANGASLQMSVNLSVKQFTQPDLVTQIRHALEETGLDARSLKLEITESVLMANPEFATGLLQQLRDMNLKLVMDDFGTGYSSLSYLHRFPVSTLKIDAAFVRKMDVDGKSAEIVQTIVMLAHTLGMDVVAEGVETPQQLARLRALKAEYGQGYLFSPPLDGEAATRLIEAAPTW
jgi:diguanylate cyclase (GGDEF)-like protein/PAS domain S-box-containing protein